MKTQCLYSCSTWAFLSFSCLSSLLGAQFLLHHLCSSISDLYMQVHVCVQSHAYIKITACIKMNICTHIHYINHMYIRTYMYIYISMHILYYLYIMCICFTEMSISTVSTFTYQLSNLHSTRTQLKLLWTRLPRILLLLKLMGIVVTLYFLPLRSIQP